MQTETWVAGDRREKMTTRRKWSLRQLGSLILGLLGRRTSKQVEIRKSSDEELCSPAKALEVATSFRMESDYVPQPDDFTDEDFLKYRAAKRHKSV